MKKFFSTFILLIIAISLFAQKAQNLHFGGNGPRLSAERIEYESGKEGFDLLETDYR